MLAVGDTWLGLAQHVTENLADWKAVYDASEPHNIQLPFPWNKQLDAFQRMIVLRAIRPDKVRLHVAGARTCAGTRMPTHEHACAWHQLLPGHHCTPFPQLIPAISAYVATEMGPRFVEPMPFAIEPSFNDSSATSPLVFVLSPGSDPMASLLKFAEKKV